MNAPHVLKKYLKGFEVTTVQQLGWAGITNGALLQLAEDEFDVLITSDQNLTGRQLAILQLPTNQVPLVAKIASRVNITFSE